MLSAGFSHRVISKAEGGVSIFVTVMHQTSRQELQNIYEGEDGMHLLPPAHQLKSCEHEIPFSCFSGRQKFKTSSRASGRKVVSHDRTSSDEAVPTFVGYREKSIPLSRSEKARMTREERIRRREVRIKQVREQEKLYAVRMVRRSSQKSENRKSEAVSQKQKAWELKQKTCLKDLGWRFKTSMINIGNAQHSATTSIGEQADEARVILKTWGKAEQVEGMRHKLALINQGRQMTKARRMKIEIEQRESTRKCVQQSQRFNATQFQAALNEAKSKSKPVGFVNTEKGESTSVKNVVSRVPSHGAGIMDFCKTHFHHAVICHNRGDKTQSNDVFMSNRGSHQYSQFVTVDGGLSGTDAALDERRLHVQRLSHREVDEVRRRERARHRCRIASEKLQMRAELLAIEKRLKTMDSTSRTGQFILYPDELSDDSQKANGAENSFVRNFIDADLSCDLNDSNVVTNESSALLFNVNSYRTGGVCNESMQTNSYLDEVFRTSDSDGNVKESIAEKPDLSHGQINHDIDSDSLQNTQGEIIRISEGLSDLATELSNVSEPKLVEHPQHENEPFYESYLKKYSMEITPSSALDSAKCLESLNHFVNDAMPRRYFSPPPEETLGPNASRTESSVIAGTVAAVAFAHDKNVEYEMDVMLAVES